MDACLLGLRRKEDHLQVRKISSKYHSFHYHQYSANDSLCLYLFSKPAATLNNLLSERQKDERMSLAIQAAFMYINNNFYLLPQIMSGLLYA